MERDAEQALLGTDDDLVAEVERDAAAAVLDPQHAAGLLEHPQRRVAGRLADPRRPVQAGDDALDVEVARAAGFRRGLLRLDVVERVAAAESDVADREAGGEDRGDEDGCTHGRAAY
jgi:hypothetical protein